MSNFTDKIARDFAAKREQAQGRRKPHQGNGAPEPPPPRPPEPPEPPEEPPEPPESPRRRPRLDAAALHGLVGDIVRTIGPHTESDPVAILVQAMVLAGCMIGRKPHYMVESTRHGVNLFALLVGATSKARKGTSFDRVRAVARATDPVFIENRVKSGMSSGEGLIQQVADQEGQSDKRLFVQEPEFAGTLAVAERSGNILTPIVRAAWDGVTLSTMTRNPMRATCPHISIVGHVTEDELRARLTRTDMASGFANRFLFVAAKRSKMLPHGGHLSESESERLSLRFKLAVENASMIDRMNMTNAAAELWTEKYEHLSADHPGMFGAVTARAEAQCLRLAMLYALLDDKADIGPEHLRAAIALWDYCEASCAHVFGDLLGDPVADEILRALRCAGPAGMTRTAIRDLFARNRSGERIGAALDLVRKQCKAQSQSRETNGRPAEVWVAVVSNEKS